MATRECVCFHVDWKKKEIVSSNENRKKDFFFLFSVDKIKEIVQTELLKLFSFIQHVTTLLVAPSCNVFLISDSSGILLKNLV